MADTIEENLEECRRVEAILADAQRLTLGARALLVDTRITLETLRAYQHHQVRMELPSHLRDGDVREDSAVGCIDRQIADINALLGDRPAPSQSEEGSDA